jgi:hypothetical protein
VGGDVGREQRHEMAARARDAAPCRETSGGLSARLYAHAISFLVHSYSIDAFLAKSQAAQNSG